MRRRSLAALLFAMLAGGCVSPGEVVVTYETDTYGAVFPVVNGDAYPLTDAERRQQIQRLVDLYCPVE